MGIADTARAKAQAAVSQAQAEIVALEAALAKAQRDMDGSAAAQDVLDSVKETPLVGSLTVGMRDQADVDAAQAKADADRLTAELGAAKSKLEFLLKAQDAVKAVTGED